MRAASTKCWEMLEDGLATTVILLCAGATRMSRRGGFPAPGEPLDAAGRRDAARLALPARFQSHVAVSPIAAARETAQVLELAGTEEPALADIDHGRWAGRDFSELAPGDLAAWLADPVAGAPGGETLEAVRLRVGEWLDGLPGQDRPICAITHASTIRAALAHALGIPIATTLAIDFAPLSRTVLSFHNTWRLQGIVPFE